MKCKVCVEIILRNPSTPVYKLFSSGKVGRNDILHNGNPYCLEHYKLKILDKKQYAKRNTKDFSR